MKNLVASSGKGNLRLDADVSLGRFPRVLVVVKNTRDHTGAFIGWARAHGLHIEGEISQSPSDRDGWTFKAGGQRPTPSYVIGQEAYFTVYWNDKSAGEGPSPSALALIGLVKGEQDVFLVGDSQAHNAVPRWFLRTEEIATVRVPLYAQGSGAEARKVKPDVRTLNREDMAICKAREQERESRYKTSKDGLRGKKHIDESARTHRLARHRLASILLDNGEFADDYAPPSPLE